MEKISLTLSYLFLSISPVLLSMEMSKVLENEVKVCSGNYNNGNKEFTGTYLDSFENGKYHESRVGVWKFWYPDGKLKFEGIYKQGFLVSKKCWNSNGEAINCKMMKLNNRERKRIFKEK
jgi:antitoxin component YwqK of YwqJK toxin-antitoxin module|tara:strand:+ start:159 stop:518 length:360 start_codon:yes stop_codon:yes gene_type:complete